MADSPVTNQVSVRADPTPARIQDLDQILDANMSLSQFFAVDFPSETLKMTLQQLRDFLNQNLYPQAVNTAFIKDVLDGSFPGNSANPNVQKVVDYLIPIIRQNLDGIASNDSDITALQNRMTAAEQAIAANTAAIQANDTDIAALDGRVTQNELDIDENAAAIAALDLSLEWTKIAAGYATSNGDSLTCSEPMNGKKEVLFVWRKDNASGRIDTSTSYPAALVQPGQAFEEGGIGGSSYQEYDITSATVVTVGSGETGSRGLAEIWIR